MSFLVSFRDGAHVAERTLVPCKLTHTPSLRQGWEDRGGTQVLKAQGSDTLTYLACANTPMTSAYRSATMCILPVLGPRYLSKV